MTKVRWFSSIRVLGLILVLIYHLFKSWLPGGFLGVDIFFTFSGYLITSLIVAEVSRDGKFDFLRYVKKRFMRIFPFLFFSIVMTLPFFCLISSDFLAGIDKQISGALGFVTNYFEILSGGSYESQLLPHPYIHTWSLAVELHYYLLWGLCNLGVIFVLKKIQPKMGKNIFIYKCVLVLSLVVMTVLSYCNMQRWFNSKPEMSIAYFDTMSHIYPFFIGSILGVVFGLKLPDCISSKLKRKASYLAPFSIILFSLSVIAEIVLCAKTKFDSPFTYKYGFLISSFLTVLLIFSCRVLHEILPESIEESSFLKHISDISYYMYLFHWPLYIVFSNVWQSNAITAIVTIVVSYLFSVFLYFIVEKLFYSPSYVDRKKRCNKKFAVSFAGLVLVVCCVFGLRVYMNRVEVSKLEEDMIVGNINQNLDVMSNMKSGLNRMNSNPFLQKNGIDNSDILKSDTNEAEQSEEKESAQSDKRESAQSDERESARSDKRESAQNEEKGPSQSEVEEGNVNIKVSIIGDSVALGARSSLRNNIKDSYVDTAGSRNLHEGYDLIMSLQESNTLGECVVVALGTNTCDGWESYVQKIINDIKPGHRLVFVTPYDGRWEEDWGSYKTTQYLRTLPEKYPFVTIADWAATISKKKELLGSDKIHIGGNTEGINMFTNVVIDAIKEAQGKSAK